MRSISLCVVVLTVLSAISAMAKPPAPCVAEVGTAGPVQTYVAASAAKNYFMKPGECLVSPNRKWSATLRSDGDFVVYALANDVSESAIWSTRTAGNPGAGLLVQQDGHFVLYRSGAITGDPPNGDPSKHIYQSNAAAKPFADYFLAIQDDGNLVLYKGTDFKSSPIAIWDLQSEALQKSWWCIYATYTTESGKKITTYTHEVNVATENDAEAVRASIEKSYLDAPSQNRQYKANQFRKKPGTC